MKSRTILGASGTTKMREVTIELKGKGGSMGVENVKRLIELLNDFKTKYTEQEINDHYMIIAGYCTCCNNCGFIDDKGADDIMQMAAVLAGNELARVKGARK